MKTRLNKGERPNLFFWRDSNGNEVDVLIDKGTGLVPVEIKAGKTITREAFAGLQKWCSLAGELAAEPVLIYGGSDSYRRSGVKVVGWKEAGEV